MGSQYSLTENISFIFKINYLLLKNIKLDLKRIKTGNCIKPNYYGDAMDMEECPMDIRWTIKKFILLNTFK